MGLLNSVLRLSLGFMNVSKNKSIKAVAKQTTRHLINYLEDGPKIDFFEALKEYIGEEKIKCPIDNISSDECSKWSELFILIVWKKTQEELAYDPTMGSESDFWMLNTTVLNELRQWEKVIEARARIRT